MKNELRTKITDKIDNSKDYSAVMVEKELMQRINDAMDQMMKEESEYTDGRFSRSEWGWEYVVEKDNLYVLVRNDDIELVENINEATKFSSYGLDIKMLVKYVEGIVLEIFSKKSIRILRSDERK